jgi:hypothetical protein
MQLFIKKLDLSQTKVEIAHGFMPMQRAELACGREIQYLGFPFFISEIFKCRNP